MPTLKEIIRASKGPHLVVTGPHSNWMEMLEHEKRPNQKALVHVINVLLGKFKHERSGRFSPSAVGNPFVPCDRAVVFGFAGAPQLAADIESAEMMDHGTDAHLRWQIEGLTLGWMQQGEVWLYDDDLLMGGSMDGLLHDNSGLELKTASHFVYNRVVTRDRDVKYETQIQGAAYMLLADIDWMSYVYENRSNGEFYEFRRPRDAKLEKEVLRRLVSYRTHVEADELPPPLDPCVKHTGSVYKYCGYRKICPLMKTVTQAQQLRADVEANQVLLNTEMGRVVPDEETPPDWAAKILALVENLPEED